MVPDAPDEPGALTTPRPLRVVLTGSECTGKTTLARALAERLGTVWVPEYGREYVDAVGRPPAADDVEPIARGQRASEERLAQVAQRVLVLDTDLVSTAVYARHYFGRVSPFVEEALAARPGDLYLLCGLDVPWKADGSQRDRGDRREEMQQLFRDALAARGLGWVEVTGSREERLETAVRAVEALRRRRVRSRSPGAGS